MPRIESTGSASDSGFAIPWKLVGVVVLIGSIWGYIWYQYVQLSPKPNRSSAAAAAARESSAKEKGIGGELTAMAEKLKLTDDQKSSISVIVKSTTDPREIRRDVARLLTREQRTIAREITSETAAKRKELRERAQKKAERYLPGQDLQWAKQAQLQVREQTAQRRKAAEEAGKLQGGSSASADAKTPTGEKH